MPDPSTFRSFGCFLLALILTGCPGKDSTGTDSGSAPVDGDSDGFTIEDGDCDDTDGTIFPSATEVCDGIDNDCDDLVDLDDDSLDPSSAHTVYLDEDMDGHGAIGSGVLLCEVPTDTYSDTETDCNDNDSSIHASASEVCDGIDNNCNDEIDEDPDGAPDWYPDADGDGFGDGTAAINSCEQPTDYIANGTDCDDADPTSYPDAEEVCDGLDNDCDGAIGHDEGDIDEDGYLDCEDCAEEDCFQLSDLYTAYDFDVSDDGSVTVVGMDSEGRLYAECFLPSGRLLNTVLIETVDMSLYYSISMSVGRAATTHQSAVGWHFYNHDWPTGDYDWQTRRAHLNADCELMAGPEKLDTELGDGILRVVDVEMSDEGVSAFIYENQSAWQYRLVMFDATGALINATQFGEGQCSGGAIGRAVGMNRATGDVIVACELGVGTGRHYQRFDATGTPIDDPMVAVPSADSDRWDYFAVQMNDDGEFVFLFRDADSVWNATFYDSAGDITTTIATDLPSSSGYQERLLVTSDGYFVLGGTGGREVYTATGEMMGSSTEGHTVRIDGMDNVYRIAGSEILVNPFPLYE